MTDAAHDELDLSRAPLLTHLIELRRRLMLSLLVFALAVAVSYLFVEDIYAFLMRPLTEVFDDPAQRRMIYTGLHEAFFTYMKLAFFTGLFFSLPLMFVQLWKFVAPGLYQHERRSLLPAFLMTPLLFVLGAALAFYVIMPLAWEFFLGFERLGTATSVAVELEARVSEYLNLVIQLVLAFGISFELPVLLHVLARIGAVTADSLRAYRKYVVVLTFLVAAFITPPDLISQLALGIPVLLLYELSILIIQWTRADATGVARRRAVQG